MNSEDSESLLSAFLDDELAQEERSDIEQAILARPELGLALENLRQTREFVAALPRPPAPAGLVTSVGRLLRIRQTTYYRRLSFSLVGASIAASLLLAVALRFPSPQSTVLVQMNELTERQRSDEPSSLSPDPEPLPIQVVEHRPSAGSSPMDVDQELGNMQEERDRQHIRSLMERKETQRVLIVTDVLNGPASDKIEKLIAENPRHHSNFGRTTVSLGIVVDPDYPSEAIVFTVIMTDAELSFFRDQVSKVDQVTAIVEDSPPVEVTTQLAEVGSILILRGTPPATLQPLGDAGQKTLATRTDDFPTLEQQQSGPHPMNRLRLNNDPRVPDGPKDPKRSSPEHTVLIWVTASARRVGS